MTPPSPAPARPGNAESRVAEAEPLTAPVNVPPEPNYCIDLDRLDRHAEANATLAGLFRRVFIKGAR